MEHPEHLRILKQGIEAWNTWRRENRLIRPDLARVDLTGVHFKGLIVSGDTFEFISADLSEVNLVKSNLQGANLEGANLDGAYLLDANFDGANLTEASLQRATLLRANLQGANLVGANLQGANLSNTDLRRAYLVWANLRGASLEEAFLQGANLEEADLEGANLSGVYLAGTVFGNTNLTTARGLETCVYHRPSILDYRTLAKSGPLPLVFLRGCGLPEVLIDYLPSLLNEPIQYDSLFISYANKDQAFAERLYTDLQNKGVRCWYAPEDMKMGDEFRSRIDISIHLHDRLLLILSEHSIKSTWVQTEVETAFDKEAKEHRLVLFPLRLDDAVMDVTIGWAAKIRRERLIGDFTRWKEHDAYQQAFTRLLRDLKAEGR